jgi:hypothetical protein
MAVMGVRATTAGMASAAAIAEIEAVFRIISSFGKSVGEQIAICYGYRTKPDCY